MLCYNHDMTIKLTAEQQEDIAKQHPNVWGVHAFDIAANTMYRVIENDRRNSDSVDDIEILPEHAALRINAMDDHDPQKPLAAIHYYIRAAHQLTEHLLSPLTDDLQTLVTRYEALGETPDLTPNMSGEALDKTANLLRDKQRTSFGICSMIKRHPEAALSSITVPMEVWPDLPPESQPLFCEVNLASALALAAEDLMNAPVTHGKYSSAAVRQSAQRDNLSHLSKMLTSQIAFLDDFITIAQSETQREPYTEASEFTFREKPVHETTAAQQALWSASTGLQPNMHDPHEGLTLHAIELAQKSIFLYANAQHFVQQWQQTLDASEEKTTGKGGRH